MDLSFLLERFIGPVLFPQQNVCPLCQRILSDPGCLCAACQKALEEQRLPCQKAVFGIPPLSLCLAAYPYEGPARDMVRLLKYRSALLLAEPLGQTLCLRLMDQPALKRRIDLVIPVPLHAVREAERGYNQALLLAQALCAPCGLSLQPALLARIQETGSQVGRTRAQRMEAMRGVFAVTAPEKVAGRCILLVDDVFTTGATLLSCADALYAAGAGEVAAVTVCRA